MGRFSPTRIVRLILAPLLSFWIAGAGCMLGCERMIATAAPNGTVGSSHDPENSLLVASGDACASSEGSQSHGCCKKRSHDVQAPETKPAEQASTSDTDRSSPEFEGTTSGMMEDCPLAMSKAVVAAKSNRSDANVSLAEARPFLPQPNAREVTAPLSAPLHLPNRGHTYLDCCAFLI